MVDVWLAGFASGAASALKQSMPTMKDETARKIADRICAAITADRVSMDRVRLLVEERVQGGNGTHIFTVYVPEDPSPGLVAGHKLARHSSI